MSRARRTIGACIVVALGGVLVPEAGAGGCHAKLPAVGKWVTVDAPRFDVGPAEPTVVHVHGADPRRIVMTNGFEVVSTRDLGCSWTWILRLPETDAVATETRRVVDVEFGGDRGATGVVGIVHHAAMAGSDVTEVYAGATGAELGQVGGDAIPGIPVDVAVAPSDGRYLYVLTAEGANPTASPVRTATPPAIWGSDDGGRSWTMRVGPDDVPTVRVDLPVHRLRYGPDPTAANDRSGLVVHPRRPTVVGAWGAAGYTLSLDGGRSWDWPQPGINSRDRLYTGINAAAVAHGPGNEMTVAVTRAAVRGVVMSIDSGREFRPRNVVTPDGDTEMPVAVAVAGPRREIIVATGRDVYFSPAIGYGAGYFFASRAPGAVVREMRGLTLYGRPAVAAQTVRGAMIGVPLGPKPPAKYKDPRRVKVSPGDVVIPPDVVADRTRAHLLPKRLARTLRAGSASDERYVLTLPENRPVDVFFLVDTSGSMAYEIADLRRGLAAIVTELTEARVNAHFGVGEFRAYDSPPAYQRIKDIGPPGAALAKALNQLTASGGGRGTETHLAALQQLATGAGYRDADMFIEPKQEANFRPGALRVVVHVTDEAFAEGPPNPSYESVVNALRAKDVHVVGIAFEGLDPKDIDPWEAVPPPPPPSVGLRRVALGTGAVAPLRGTDCDGDGDTELAAGEPLVCVLPPSDAEQTSAMAQSIVNLLLSIRDLATVELKAYHDGEAVGQVFPPVVENVDLAAAQLLTFEVRYVCPPGVAAREADVLLVATARGRPIAEAEATVVCEPVPERPMLVPPVIPPRAIQPVYHPPQPPSAQTEPGTQSQSQSQSQSQTQSQSQSQAQGAAATQRQQQTQVAVAYQASERTRAQHELAFSAAEPLPSFARLLQIAAALGVGVGYVLLSRRRTAASVVRK